MNNSDYPSANADVQFYEELGLFDCLFSILNGREVYYCTQSILMRVAHKFAPKFFSRRLKTISYGSLEKVTDIRKDAYQAAAKAITKIDARNWGLSLLQSFSVDNNLIVEKYLFQVLFEKYEFYGLINQFSKENPSRKIKVFLTQDIWGCDVVFGSATKILMTRYFLGCKLLLYVLGIPLYILYFIYKNWGGESKILIKVVVCEVDSVVIIDMFRDLFGDSHELNFVAKKGYFGEAQQKEFGLIAHHLNAEGRMMLWSVAFGVVEFVIKHWGQCLGRGKIFFELCQMFAHGILNAPNIENSAYLTFEHLSVEKAIRNEILKARGNVSIFVPYNIYSSSPFYAPEYMLNYDVLCSPGAICEQAYILQGAKTKNILRTGSYHANKQVARDDGFGERVAPLVKFKGTAVGVTILCNGVEDVTLSGEVRLMALAQRLASEPGVKVLIRQKPVQPSEKYKDFYKAAVKGYDSILLTHFENELYDFLGVTDLCITSNSSSVLEFCAAGVDFFCGEFLG